MRKSYAPNKRLIEEIHKSKNSYCEYDRAEYAHYDYTCDDINEITEPNKIYRYYTWDHIPKNDGEIIIQFKTTEYMPVMFRPFKHYHVNHVGQMIEVGRSHTKNGQYCNDHGRITDALTAYVYEMARRMKNTKYYVGYSEDMVQEAMLRFVQHGLRFDESKPNKAGYLNPFAYFSTLIMNQFHLYIKARKKLAEEDFKIIEHELIAEGLLPMIADDDVEQEASEVTVYDAAGNITNIISKEELNNRKPVPKQSTKGRKPIPVEAINNDGKTIPFPSTVAAALHFGISRIRLRNIINGLTEFDPIQTGFKEIRYA